MPVQINQVDISLETFSHLVEKTNMALAAISQKAVTVESNAAVGTARVDGTVSANVIRTSVLRGGTAESPSDLVVSSNVIFQSDVTTFTTGVQNFGAAANVTIRGANTTHHHLSSNTETGALFFSTSRLDTTVQDVAITAPATRHVLTYNTGTSKWINVNIDSLNANAAALQGYNAAAFPRKAESATIVNPWTFSANVTFGGANISFTAGRQNFGAAANVSMYGANTTHHLLSSNVDTGALYFSTSRLDTTVQDVTIATPTARDVLAYNTGTSKWVNLNIDSLSINAVALEGYNAAAFPRKAESATIANPWTYSANVSFNSNIIQGNTRTQTITANVAANTSSVVNSFAVNSTAAAKTVKYLVSAFNAAQNAVYSTEILVSAFNNQISYADYAILNTGNTFITLVPSLSGTTVNLTAVSTAATSSRVTVQATFLTT